MKKSNRSKNLPKNLSVYAKIAGIGVGMAALFFLGFWLMSLLDRTKETPTVTNSPAPVATQPATDRPNNITTTPIAATTTTVSPTTTPLVTTSPITPVRANNSSLVYRVIDRPKFIPSAKLQKLVDRVVNYSASNKLPTSALSVTLIDTKTGEKADYHGSIERYPASIVKLFWLVAIEQKIADKAADETKLKQAIVQMMLKSDNDGASQIVDTLTKTKSTNVELPATELSEQKQQRQYLNDFFRKSGYSTHLNVSQKTFPIPREKMDEPRGFDRQLRGSDPQQPTRNKLTTDDAARLMYEIATDRSIGLPISQKMQKLLSRNLNPKFWQQIPAEDFNPVAGFFGEGLSVDRAGKILSKAGWTPTSRQEVAFIKSKDNKTEYVLVVFGDDAAYGKRKRVFPEISNLVYNEMQKVPK
jgi:beta-lactamase class A